MKLYALALFLACVSAAPQDFSPNTDVDDDNTGSGGGIFNIFEAFFPSLFGREPSPGAGSNFPGVFGIPGFGSIPDGNENSTYEVTNVDGNRVEVNRTTTTNDDGSFVFTEVLVKVSPDEEGGSESGSEGSDTASGTDTVFDGETGPVSPPPEVPAEVVDPSINKEEVSASLVRRKRWSVAKWLRAILRPKVESKTVPPVPASLPLIEEKSHEDVDYVDGSIPVDSSRKPHDFDGNTNAISSEAADDAGAVVPESSEAGNRLALPSLPHSLEGDTRVNYLGPVLRDNPDAEIFDVELVRADEDRFFNRGDRPAYTEPLSSSNVAESFRSEPLIAMPLRSGPVLAETSESVEDMAEPEKQEPFSEDSFEPVLSENLQSQAEEPEDIWHSWNSQSTWSFKRSLRLL